MEKDNLKNKYKDNPRDAFAPLSLIRYKQLTTNEKWLLVEIDRNGAIQYDDVEFPQHFATFNKISAKTVEKKIKKLIKDGFLEVLVLCPTCKMVKLSHKTLELFYRNINYQRDSSDV